MKLSELITKFCAYLLTQKRVSQNTYLAYKRDLSQFQDYCDTKKISLSKIDRSTLNAFLAYLKNRGLTARSMARKIAVIKGMFTYAHERYEIENHAQELMAPKIKKSLPEYLTIEETEQLFDAADEDDSLQGKRNKMMLFLMYVTGMRVSELIALKVSHVHRDTSTVAVDGKRGKQRLVPIPDGMMKELCGYIDQVRPALLSKKGTSDYLFPVIYAKKIKPLTRQAFWIIIKSIWKVAGIAKPISPHTVRHSFATHMLNKGANLRSLQLLLGHEQLATVQIYTHVDTGRLRSIYDKKHPRSR